MEISVIIPMYNTEKYIGECLESLANQTFQDFDVIIVDDCSTDNSREVVQSFFEKFGDRLTLAKLSEHVGLSGIVRNFALNMARGKYVYFLDSDDFITEDALENLYAVAEKFEADVVHAEKYFAFRDGADKRELTGYQTGEFVTEPTLETFDIGERVKNFSRQRFIWSIWSKLFRRKFLCENKITFPAIKAWVDFIFTFECLVTAKNYVRVPNVFYYYRIREGSITNTAPDAARFMDNIVNVVKSLDDFTGGRKFFEDNPQYKFMPTDFFVQYNLKALSKFFLAGKHGVGGLYDFLRKEIFSRRPQDIAALTACLFSAACLSKINSNHMEVSN